MNKKDFDKGIIIDRPTLKSKTRNFSEWTLNILGWILWIFLMRPLFLLFMWFVGYKIFYLHMIKLEGYTNLDKFIAYTIVIFSIFLILMIWHKYNVFMFRNKERRVGRKNVSNKEMTDFFKFEDPEKIEDIKKARNIDIYFNDNDIIKFKTGENNPTVKISFNPQDKERQLRTERLAKFQKK